MHPLYRLLVVALLTLSAAAAADSYFPPAGEWQRATADTVGMNPEALIEAVRLAQESAVVEPSDLEQVITASFKPREPNFRILGPTRPREESSGVIIRNGMLVAEWGDTQRVDMTFSVTKSYLSTMMALALRDGLVNDLHERVGRSVHTGEFEAAKNEPITWHHLLNQTSDWAGELWEIHDWADRPEGTDPTKWMAREVHEPGTYFKYNDVRVNLLAYSLMQVFREPLPVVLRREVMDPIGASTTWRWHGYRNSWATIDGLKMQSVSGGAHFGGGLFISTMDHARFGYLFLRNGSWNGQQIIPTTWIHEMRQPTPVKPDYGYMWWLNTGQERIPAAPESAYWAAGFGGNYIYVDPEHDLLIVMRWVPALQEVVTAVLAAIED